MRGGLPPAVLAAALIPALAIGLRGESVFFSLRVSPGGWGAWRCGWAPGAGGRTVAGAELPAAGAGGKGGGQLPWGLVLGVGEQRLN